MKIVTWNCNGAFRKKYDYVLKFHADIYIIQECEDPNQSNDDNYKNWASNYVWTGENKNKGLGVFAKEVVKIEKLDWEMQNLKYFISCRINGDFKLLGTWCHGANSPTFGYIGQLWKYLQLHKNKLGKSILAGDLNSNVIWDKWDRWWNHSDVVRELYELGIQSVYHNVKNEEQGKETKPTFYLQRKLSKPYHIDYVFCSKELYKNINTIEIGQASDWLVVSDHMPVIVEFNI